MSYLGYGNDVARNSVIEKYGTKVSEIAITSPCFHKGYADKWSQDIKITVSGSGDATKCGS